MMYSFLLIGQSNMAGRGFPSEVEPAVLEAGNRKRSSPIRQ